MLKAALAGAKDKGQAPPPKAEPKLDGSSFPCIVEGQPLPDEASLAADVESRLKLHRQSSLAGSMPRGYRNSVSGAPPGCWRSGRSDQDRRRPATTPAGPPTHQPPLP